MTRTQIRDALTEISHAVDVPAPDRVAFERLVRAERVQRRARRGLGLGAAAAAAVLVGGVALTGLPDGGASGGEGGGDDDPVATATDSAPDPRPESVAGMSTPALLEGRLVWMGDTTWNRTGEPATRVVGSTTSNNGALVTDGDDRVWWVRSWRIVSEPQRSERADGQPVRTAVVDRTGSWLTYVDTQGTVHVRLSWDDAQEKATGEIGDGELLAGDGDVWLVLRDGQVSVEGRGAPVVLDAGEDAVGAQIGENTVAVQTIGGASFFDLQTGEPLQLDLGGAVGGLSPEGTWYATAASEQQTQDGMSPNLNLVDTHTGDMRPVHGYDAAQQALSMWWADEDRFAVLSQDGDHRVYWQCSVSSDRCTKAWDDDTGTLTLPIQ
jgi:hypothetical protein